MIKVIEFCLDDGAGDSKAEHSELNAWLNDGYQVIGHSFYQSIHYYGVDLELEGQKSNWERFTLYKSDNLSPQTALDDLILTTLVSAERGESSKNARPIWRCLTDDGERVNIFLNTDEPEKDNYSLFKQAGWADDLDAIPLYGTVDLSIQIAMKKNGRWWEIVKVRTKPEPIAELDDIPFD